MKIPRNALCPCGSGKKFKHCCLNTTPANQITPSDQSLSFGSTIIQEAEKQGVSSIEDLNAIAAKISLQSNQRPLDEFMGLSPEQMSCFLYQPFDSPALVTFNTEQIPEAHILTLFESLASAIGTSGLKATAKGNLPLNLCKTLFEDCTWDTFYGIRNIRSEVDFDGLHCTRLTAELAKLIVRRKGQFQLTALGRKLIEPANRGKLYFTLLKAYTQEFNWGYRDGCPDAEIIQTGFLFTLYLIAIYGEKSRPSADYESAFITAFPMLLEQIKNKEPTYEANRCYSLRALKRFAYFFGLLDLEHTSSSPMDDTLMIKKASAFDQFISFHR